VTDDGVVYSFSVLPHAGSRFRKLPQGAEELETVFDDFPSDFSFWEPSVFLGPAEAVMLGRFGGALQDHVAGIVVVDLATGEATSHRLPELTLLTLIESDAGDQTASENAEPALVWDESRNRILIVHGVETKVSILDLGTGEVSTHDWSTPTTQLADLFAWLIPPAHAKGGPSRGTRRTAVLSPSGDRLFVASSISRIVEFPPGDGWYVEGISQGLEVDQHRDLGSCPPMGNTGFRSHFVRTADTW